MSKIIIPAAILLVLIVLLFVLVKALKGMATTDDGIATGPTWTLHELTRLRDTGELSIEEYERLKARAVAELRRSTASSTHPVKSPSNSTDSGAGDTNPQ